MHSLFPSGQLIACDQLSLGGETFMVNASAARLHLGERIRLRMLEAMEEFALAAVPRGPLRRHLLEQVDRGFASFVPLDFTD